MDDKAWKFISYEHGGTHYDAMWQCSEGCVSARVHLNGNYGWSYEKSKRHEGPNPIYTAQMLMSKIIDRNL